MDRRHFLRAAAASPLLASSGLVRAGEDDDRAPVIDTHLHCFAGPDDPRFPYHPEGPYQPEEPATPERLLRLMAEAGVDYAVVVHPEPYQDDHRYLEHCLDVGTGQAQGHLPVLRRQAGLAGPDDRTGPSAGGSDRRRPHPRLRPRPAAALRHAGAAGILGARRRVGPGGAASLRAPLRPRLRAADRGVPRDDGHHRPPGSPVPGHARGARRRGRLVPLPEHGHEALVAAGDRASIPTGTSPR